MSKLLVAFALSGMSALIYELVWTRKMQILFGSTIFAASAILGGFLTGFGLGSYFTGKIVERKDARRCFVGLELTLAFFGFLVPSLISFLSSEGFVRVLNFPLIPFLLAFVITSIPAGLMGALWPVTAKLYVRKAREKEAGVLYFANSLGGASGPVVAAFLLVPALGLSKTSYIAGMLNLLAALLGGVEK